MADDKVQFIIESKDEATPAIEKVKKGFGDMQKSFASTGLAFAGAGAAIGLVVNDWVQSASEAEKAQKQLEHAVIDVSHGTKEQLKAMEDLSAELQKKGVLDDDAIKTGMAQLSTFGLSTKAVHDLSGSMADLSVNQFGIGASGEQVAQSANMIAKALNGQFGVLEKSGIRFTEAQQHAIQFGTELEKVKAINEGFAQNLKFTNEVALGTFEGAMANLNNRFGDFKENLGAAVIPMITALGGVLGQVVTWLENMDPSVRDAIAQGIAFAGAFAAVAGAAMLLIAAINPVTIAIVAVGAAFALWKLYGDDIIKYLQGWGIDLGAIWEGIKKAVFDAWNWIVTNIIPVVSKFIEDMKTRITPMIQFITDHWAEITTVLQSAWNTITMLWSVFWEGVQLIFTIAWELFAGALKTGLSIIQGDWSGAWTAIKEMFGGVWNGIVTFFKSIWNTITKFLDDQLKQVGSSFDEMSKTVTATWSGFWNGLKNIVDGIVGEITKIINNIISTVKGAIEYINQLINLATKAGSAVASDIGSRLTYTGSPGSQFNHNAIGGRQNAGSPTVVGEKGREIFVPSTSGRIIPNNEIGGGNKTINISLNFNGPVSTKEVALEYMDIAIRELQLHSQVI